jgi:hypothetical protein
MGTSSAAYEPFAWLTREQIGLCLRERYRVPKELPPRLLKLVRKLQAVEGNKELSPGLYMLFSKLDALEGNQLLRACRKRLHNPNSLPSFSQ